MRKILITGAGGSAGLGFILSLKNVKESFYIIGCDSNKYYLERAVADEKYLIPRCNESTYTHVLEKIIDKTRPDFIYSQVDDEIEVLSEMREFLDSKGVRYFLPSKKTISICLNKFESYKYWEKASITVPKTFLINNEQDLKNATEKLGQRLWIREIKGAFGKSSLPVTSFKQAKNWIQLHDGYGKFTAAELLDATKMITWQSIWHNGKLIVAQTRKRLYWEFANRAPSGVTGLTGGGITLRDSTVDAIAMKSISAIDKNPNGIFSVDLTYDTDGVANPTEINIGRFFTTTYFFTKAGLNMPYIFIKIGFGEKPPIIARKLNPLPSNLVWIRGLDFAPTLTTTVNLVNYEKKLEEMRK